VQFYDQDRVRVDEPAPDGYAAGAVQFDPLHRQLLAHKCPKHIAAGPMQIGHSVELDRAPGPLRPCTEGFDRMVVQGLRAGQEDNGAEGIREKQYAAQGQRPASGKQQVGCAARHAPPHNHKEQQTQGGQQIGREVFRPEVAEVQQLPGKRCEQMHPVAPLFLHGIEQQMQERPQGQNGKDAARSG